MNKSTPILINDFSFYIETIYKELFLIIQSNNIVNRILNRTDIRLIMEYCIIKSLSKTLCLPIVFDKNDLNDFLYDKIKIKSDSITFSLMNKSSLNMFNGMEVRVVLVSNNLYIFGF